MLTVKEKGLLLNIIDHCKRIELKIVGATRDSLNSDEDLKEIVCFHILQIGELAKKFELSFVEKHNSVPWRNIKGMRDVVAHGYGTIDLDKVWTVVSQEITPLREYCESILANEDCSNS